MKVQRSGIFQYILILILVMAIVRFFPVIARLIQATSIGARAYWWVILPVLVISWVSWRIFRRVSVVKKSEYQFEAQRLRDVTGTAEGSSDCKQSESKL